MIQLIVLLPLLAAAIAGLGNKALGKLPAKIVTTGALFASCAMSWPIFISFLTGHAEPYVAPAFTWIQSGSFDAQWALRVDTMTAVMLVVITSVSSLVHLYSWGYMEEEPDQPRFFAYLSLFTFAMLMLVTANNLLQMFFGWEGVGLASYLLIGFWFRKPSANAAAIKAFVVNRVGDLGFMMGIFGTYLVFNTISIPEILAAAPSMAGSTIGFLGHRFDTMTVLCLLLFIGAMGKSAQLGLHTWLPDAMEGPTPVSALIHAATMVTAGVFMVCRLSPMFETSPTALGFVTFIGAATCLFAATVGTVQNDIKRVIAYSTCSQLGYMFFAAGVGAYGAAMFHLFTHAFFKALLFLGAGSVIHAMHHEQDMRYYGALRKEIDHLLDDDAGHARHHGRRHPAGWLWLCRLLFEGRHSRSGLCFGRIGRWCLSGRRVRGFAHQLLQLAPGVPDLLRQASLGRFEHIQHAVHGHHEGVDEEDGHGHDAHGHDDHDHHAHEQTGTAGYHPHESPWVMLIPLVLLSLGAVFAGFLFHDQFIGPEGGIEFWKGALAFDSHLMHASHEVPTWVKFGPFAVMITGLAIAWLSYIKNTDWPRRFVATFGALYQFLLNKWYFDELYHFLFVKPAFAIGRFFWKFGDVGFIDRFGPNGLAALVVQGNKVTRRLQSGYLYTYALVMLIGLAAAATWAMTR